MQDSVLLIGSTEKGRALMQTLVTEGERAPGTCRLCQSGSEARRAMLESDWGLVVINTPLSDESGLELSAEMAHSTLAGVLLLVKAELAEAVMDRVEDAGVMVVAKPVARPMFDQAVRFAAASRGRLSALRAENARLEKKLTEQRYIDRAKCVLIQFLGMSEEQAHRHIEKQAMDTRQTKIAVAKDILATYEM